ncbi:MAG: CD1247 N-terminal domain-containing protein [Solirubrobacterales bacterium]
MNSVTSKVAFLSGYVEGLELDKTTKEGKAINQIIETLKQIAQEIDVISENQEELEEYLNDIDEDLAFVEDDLYDIEDDYEDDEDFVELICGDCGETVYVDPAIMKDMEQITCPNCHKAIVLEQEIYED